MIKTTLRSDKVRARHERLRKKITGTAERPRMAVFKSLNHISVQMIDDTNGVTLLSASSQEKAFTEKKLYGGNIEAAKKVGELIAKRAKEKGISTVVMDRGGNLYHGRVAALAQAAREAGLVF